MFCCFGTTRAATGSDVCGPNWNDLPTEMKLEVVKWMNYTTKRRLRLCSKHDYELVESTYSFHIPYMEIKGQWDEGIAIYFSREPHKKVCFEVEEGSKTGRYWLKLITGSDRVGTRELLFEKSYEPFNTKSMLISLLSNKKITIGVMAINELDMPMRHRLMKALVKTDIVGKWILGRQHSAFLRHRASDDSSFENRLRTESVELYDFVFSMETMSNVPLDERVIIYSNNSVFDYLLRQFPRIFEVPDNIFFCCNDPDGFETKWFGPESKMNWPWLTKVDKNTVRFTKGLKVMYARMSECGTIIQMWRMGTKELPVGELKFYTETEWELPSGKQSEWYWGLVKILDQCINQSITVE